MHKLVRGFRSANLYALIENSNNFARAMQQDLLPGQNPLYYKGGENKNIGR